MTLRQDHLDATAVSLLLACCLFRGFQQVLVKATLAELPPLFQSALRASRLIRISAEKLLFYQLAVSAAALTALSLLLGERWTLRFSAFAGVSPGGAGGLARARRETR